MKALEIELDSYHQYIDFRNSGHERLIYDPVRKKEYKVQPEELVRQSWIQFLYRNHKVSFVSLSVEKTIQIESLNKRFDMVMYSKGMPKVLFEFKSFNIKINEKTCHQAASYNLALKVPFIIISNGIQHFAFHIDFNSNMISPLEDLSFISSVI